MWQPTTRSESAATISFMSVRSSRPLIVPRIGLKRLVKTSIGPASFAAASSSLKPTDASGGWQKTAEGTNW